MKYFLGLSCVINPIKSGSDKSTNSVSVCLSSVEVLSTVVKPEPIFATIGVYGSVEHENAVRDLVGLFQRLVPGGRLTLSGVEAASVPVFKDSLILGGFVDIESDLKGTIISTKPIYSADAMPLPKSNITDKKQLWKLMTNTSADDAIIDDDDLLTEEDMLDSSIGKNSDGEAKKKRACKDCSCGLSEVEQKVELADAKAEGGKVTAPVSSSCGGCSKGDLFRCGGCPYLGTPAFDPSEKPEILIKSDGSKILLDTNLNNATNATNSTIDSDMTFKKSGNKVFLDVSFNEL